MPLSCSISAVVTRLRSARARWVVLGALILSVALVLGAIPGRREGNRSAEEAFLPLRPLTPQEAAFLLEECESTESPHTVIVGVEGGDAILATRVFVVPRSIADSSHGEWLDTREQTAPYRIASVSWEGYSSLYRVPRVELEHARGKPLDEAGFAPDFVEKRPVSFAPHRLGRYVAIEIAFLTTWLTLLVLLLRRLRRITLLLPVLVPALWVPMIFVWFYSPAFFDADWFHQRVVLEPIALACWGVAGFFLLLPATASLVLFAALRLAELLASRRNAGVAGYRRSAVGVLLAIACLYMIVRYGAYRVQLSSCRASVGAVVAGIEDGSRLRALLSSMVTLPANTNLMKAGEAPQAVQARVDSLLTMGGQNPSDELVLLVRNAGPSGEELFLWRNGFRYADFRELGPGFGAQIDADQLMRIRQVGSHKSGFGRVFADNLVCGRALQVDGREVIAAAKRRPRWRFLGIVLW